MQDPHQARPSSLLIWDTVNRSDPTLSASSPFPLRVFSSSRRPKPYLLPETVQSESAPGRGSGC